MKTSAVVLAAGKGVRMCSEFPKVVHKAAGKPMIQHVIETIQSADITDIIVVIGHGRDKVMQMLQDYRVRFAIQEEQLGTGHALLQAKDFIDSDSTVIVLSGDIPLLRGETLRQLRSVHHRKNAACSFISADLPDPYGYGRVVRNSDQSFSRIVEERDADEAQRLIKEINSGIYCFQAEAAFEMLSEINTDNVQGEYYLTDVLEMLKKNDRMVQILKIADKQEIYGINDRVQLAYAEAALRNRKNIELMKKGVTIIDPASTFIDWDVNIGEDTILHPFTLIEGKTSIGEACEIGPYCRINDSAISDRVIIESSRINGAKIGRECTIGPYAYLRPQSELHDNVKIGDFAEVKKSVIGDNSKIPHLSYIGDAVIGKGVNIGAGTITCNYDGEDKYPTIIGDNAFVGSNTNLVAPVTVGENSTIGAGSTITQNVLPKSLAVERAQQKQILNWVRKRK